jgi:ABC-type transporter lipoprotein component MlaA
LAALRVVSAREAAIETVDGLRANSPDPYVTIRTVFGQSRASAIRNGRQSVEDLPDFGGPP